MQLRDWVEAQRPATVAQVAERLGIGRVALHRLMAGHTMPARETCVSIERATAGAVAWRDMEAAHADYRAAEPRATEYRAVLKDFAS